MQSKWFSEQFDNWKKQHTNKSTKRTPIHMSENGTHTVLLGKEVNIKIKTVWCKAPSIETTLHVYPWCFGFQSKSFDIRVQAMEMISLYAFYSFEWINEVL